jgi:hypothetical protein
MKPYFELIQDSLALRNLLDVYLEMRKHFQELGFSESDLDDPPTYTMKMMRLHDRFTDRLNSLHRMISDYGFNIERDELVNYVHPLLLKINEITPLKNGDNKGNNTGDEDNQRD